MTNTQRGVPEGLPMPNSTTAYWQAWPHPLARYRSSDSVPPEADIVIIGTGLAGVATAYHILTSPSGTLPKPKVVLLEARQACSGATGRNGGHTKITAAGAMKFTSLFGSEETAKIGAHQAAQMTALKATVEIENLDCELQLRRSFDVFFDKEHALAAKAWLQEQRNEGVEWVKNIQWLEGENVERITGVKGIKGAMSVPAASLWPYKFVTGLLAKVLELGALLYTETPVYSVKSTKGSGTNMVETARGVMKASKVIFATNGYSAALLDQYVGVITPIRGQASHLVAGSPSHHDLNLNCTYNLHYDPNTADYLVPQPNGGILLGGGQAFYRDNKSKWWNSVDDTKIISDRVTDHFNSVMGERFRGWEKSNAKADFVWSGIMGVTPDSVPHVGRVPGSDSQWILAGFNGGGMSLIFTLGQGIARMVLEGVSYEDTDMPVLFKTTEERLVAAKGASVA
ncbi:FAD dependent oxidoreductase [Thozetella sp. PMI_491]|nr:FAD dependent oxidoreductase [Thozetella sp. PMI_491]